MLYQARGGGSTFCPLRLLLQKGTQRFSPVAPMCILPRPCGDRPHQVFSLQNRKKRYSLVLLFSFALFLLCGTERSGRITLYLCLQSGSSRRWSVPCSALFCPVLLCPFALWNGTERQTYGVVSLVCIVQPNVYVCPSRWCFLCPTERTDRRTFGFAVLY